LSHEIWGGRRWNKRDNYQKRKDRKIRKAIQMCTSDTARAHALCASVRRESRNNQKWKEREILSVRHQKNFAQRAALAAATARERRKKT